MVLSRYCRRAKGVFKSLNKVPYVVELDERGLLMLPLDHLVAYDRFSCESYCLIVLCTKV